MAKVTKLEAAVIKYPRGDRIRTLYEYDPSGGAGPRVALWRGIGDKDSISVILVPKVHSFLPFLTMRKVTGL